MPAFAKLHASCVEEIHECGGGFAAVGRHGIYGGDQFAERMGCFAGFGGSGFGFVFHAIFDRAAAAMFKLFTRMSLWISAPKAVHSMLQGNGLLPPQMPFLSDSWRF